MNLKDFFNSRFGIITVVAWVLCITSVLFHFQAESRRALERSRSSLEAQWQQTLSNFSIEVEKVKSQVNSLPSSVPFPEELSLAQLGDFLRSLTEELELQQRSGNMVKSDSNVIWEWSVLGDIRQTLRFLREVLNRRSDLVIPRWDLSQEPSGIWRLTTEVSYEPF